MGTGMIREISHLSAELIPLTPKLNGVPTTDDVSVAFVPQNTPPTNWKPIDVAEDGTSGYLLSGTDPNGYYDLYVRVDRTPEIPVLVSDTIRLV